MVVRGNISDLNTVLFHLAKVSKKGDRIDCGPRWTHHGVKARRSRRINSKYQDDIW